MRKFAPFLVLLLIFCACTDPDIKYCQDVQKILDDISNSIQQRRFLNDMIKDDLTLLLDDEFMGKAVEKLESFMEIYQRGIDLEPGERLKDSHETFKKAMEEGILSLEAMKQFYLTLDFDYIDISTEHVEKSNEYIIEVNRMLDTVRSD